MRRIWNDDDVTKVVKKMAETPMPQSSFDQAWLKIEDRLTARKNRFWNHIVWKPWGHPVRWVMVSACLFVAYTGVTYHQNSLDQADMDSYLIAISNPTENIVKDLGVEKVSVLLGDAPSSAPEVKVDDHLDSIAADEILL